MQSIINQCRLLTNGPIDTMYKLRVGMFVLLLLKLISTKFSQFLWIEQNRIKNLKWDTKLYFFGGYNGHHYETKLDHSNWNSIYVHNNSKLCEPAHGTNNPTNRHNLPNIFAPNELVVRVDSIIFPNSMKRYRKRWSDTKIPECDVVIYQVHLRSNKCSSSAIKMN